jgi:hypothetical protein
MDEQSLNEFLDRTAQLHEAVGAHVSSVVPVANDRFVVAFQAGVLSIEHATGALILISQRLIAPAIALHRTQFESLVRGIWLLHAASDEWVAKLSEPLTQESAKKANEGLMLAEMLKHLENSSAPEALVNQLKSYRDVAWKALSSYTHGGIHPIARTISGYPPQLARDAVRNSNGLIALAAQLASIVTGNPQAMVPIRQLHSDFIDCLPVSPDA